MYRARGRLMALRCGWVCLTLVVAACGNAPSPPAEFGTSTTSGGGAVAETVEVELDIFSGMPNPEWRLSDADAALFLRKVDELPEASPAQLANNLGYRGFIVRIQRDPDETRILIQNGTVQSTRADTTTYHNDTDRALERWLLNSGRPFLDSEMFALVDRELP